MLRKLAAPHGVWDAVVAIMTSWHEGKVFIEHSVSVSHDSLHVIVGVLIWLAFALLLRRPVTSWKPWLWLLAIILWNETVDLWMEQWPDPGQQYGEGAKDVIVTMLVPTLIMFAARLRPDLFRGTAAGRRR
jgi:hypothetical protein